MKIKIKIKKIIMIIKKLITKIIKVIKIRMMINKMMKKEIIK